MVTLRWAQNLQATDSQAQRHRVATDRKLYHMLPWCPDSVLRARISDRARNNFCSKQPLRNNAIEDLIHQRFTSNILQHTAFKNSYCKIATSEKHSLQTQLSSEASSETRTSQKKDKLIWGESEKQIWSKTLVFALGDKYGNESEEQCSAAEPKLIINSEMRIQANKSQKQIWETNMRN